VIKINTQASVVQLVFPDGIKSGLRIAQLINAKGEILTIPRNKMPEIEKWKRHLGVGIYFLIGFDELTNEKKVYVGEAEDCLNRLKQHNLKKEFWNIALIFTIGEDLNKFDIKYLEWLSLKEIEERNRYSLDNEVRPKEPKNINVGKEVILRDYYSYLKILVSTLGYPFFEKISEPGATNFICKSKYAYARGQYTDEGFVVLKNSKCRKDTNERCMQHVIDRRNNLLEQGILKISKEHLVFQEDYLFDKPSQASSVVLGSHSNGWIEWKRENDNKTLDAIYRK